MARLVFAALAALCVAAGAGAAYPEKPIRFVIPSAAGGSPDVLMRILDAAALDAAGGADRDREQAGGSFTIGTMEW